LEGSGKEKRLNKAIFVEGRVLFLHRRPV